MAVVVLIEVYVGVDDGRGEARGGGSGDTACGGFVGTSVLLLAFFGSV